MCDCYASAGRACAHTALYFSTFFRDFIILLFKRLLLPFNVLRRMAVNGEDYRTRPVFDPAAHGLSPEFRYFLHCCTVPYYCDRIENV